MPQPNGKKLTPAEHEEKAYRAYELSLKGVPRREISEELNVSKTTVSSLLKEERQNRRKERIDPAEDALSHYERIIREGWSFLEQIRTPTSYNIPAIMNSIITAQKAKDAITGILAPHKAEWYGRLEERMDLSHLSDEELETLGQILERISSSNGAGPSRN